MVLSNADIARLHGCVLHQIEASFNPNYKAKLGVELSLLNALMMDSDSKLVAVLDLGLLLECVFEEQIREVIGRAGMRDKAMLKARYEYAGKLESLRTKLESMIKE